MAAKGPSPAAQAIKLWEELTGQPVDSGSFSFSLGESFNLYDANKRIRQALKLTDDLTVTLIVKQVLAGYLEYQYASFGEIVRQDEALQSRLSKIRELDAVLNEPTLYGRQIEFFDYCLGVLAHYREMEIEDLPAETSQLVHTMAGFVGLDAYHGLDELTRLMLRDDGPAGHPATAKISWFIFSFGSIEELIGQAEQMPEGFALSVIRAPHLSDSYFVLSVRSGQRTFLLSDKGNYTHPLQEGRMRSRNDRYNLRRIEGSGFPYRILDIVWSDNGRHSRPGGNGTALTAPNGLEAIARLTDLEDDELLWFHLLIDQCKTRYFTDQQTEPRLALGSMIRLPNPWGEERETNLPVPAEYELVLERKSSSELTTAFMHGLEPEWSERHNPNVWMEERFAHQVPDEVLYLPGEALTGDQIRLSTDLDGITVAPRDVSHLPFWDKQRLPSLKLQGIESTSMATSERVIRDAYYIARHNQVEVIKALVKEDYKARAYEMRQWVIDAVAANKEQWLDPLLRVDHRWLQVDGPEYADAMARLDVGADAFVQSSSGCVRIMGSAREVRIYYTPVAKQNTHVDPEDYTLADALGLRDTHYDCYRCALDPSQNAQLFIVASLNSIIDLMKFTGLPLDEIPPELHDRGIEHYTGNSILDRVDPLSVPKNPWKDLRLQFLLPVSLKAFKAYRRRLGLTTPRAAELEEWAREEAVKLSQERRTAKMNEEA